MQQTKHLHPVRESSNNITLNDLPEGFVIPHARAEQEYTIQQKFEEGGEGFSYLALDKDGKKKVVKIRETAVTKGSELEENLEGEFRRINGVLDTHYQAFLFEDRHITTVGDYVEGRNLEQEVNQTSRVFTQGQVVDFLIQVTERYLSPLHKADLVHRDIKPQNTITNGADGEEKTYDLIDFGLLREHNATATLTIGIKGTPGYTRIKPTYEKSDDHYSLARTAYYLLTGNHPEMILDEKYDQLRDEEKIGALEVDAKFKEILMKMLGHNKKNRYKNNSALLKDLGKLQKSGGGSSTEEVGIDLASARALTQYREASVMPLELQRQIKGIKSAFSTRVFTGGLHQHRH